MTTEELLLLAIVVVFVTGLLLTIWGATERGRLPAERRKNHGLARLSIGIVLMAVMVLVSLGWGLLLLLGTWAEALR